MAKMVGLGSSGNLQHNSRLSRRNRTDRRQWREFLYRTKRSAKAREKREWQNEAEE